MGQGGTITLKFMGKGDGLNFAALCLALGGGAEAAGLWLSPQVTLCFNVFPVRETGNNPRQRENAPDGVGQLWGSLPQDVMDASGEGRIPFATYISMFLQVGIHTRVQKPVQEASSMGISALLLHYSGVVVSQMGTGVLHESLSSLRSGDSWDWRSQLD